MMNEIPLISIIIPTYNASSVITRCLESIVLERNYKCRATEILIIDGASQDRTVALAESFSHKLPKLHIISEPDRGIYDAMNKGLELASGAWLHFLGADDQWIHAERIVELLDQAHSCVDILQINARKGDDGEYSRAMTRGRLLAGEEFNHQTLFYKTSLVGGLRYSLKYPLAADQLFNMELITLGKAQLKHIPETLVHYANTGLSAQQKDIRWAAEKNSWIKKMFSLEEVSTREKWRLRERWIKRIIRVMAGGTASRKAVLWIQDILYKSSNSKYGLTD